jgi:Spy/CpxP family protein refolding chaperone
MHGRIAPGSPAPGRLQGLLLLGSLLALLAQPVKVAAAPWGAPPEEEALGVEGAEPGEDLRETIEIYMLARMKQELELTADQEERLVPLVQDLSASRHRFRKERRLALMRLRPLAEDPATSESTLRAELERIQEAETSFREEECRRMDRIREILSTRQEARFVLFIEQFVTDMQRRLRQMRQLHGGPGPGPGGGGPMRRHGGPPGGF